MALKLEVMIDCCNDTWLKGMMDQSDVQRTGECSMRNRQSDSIVTFLSSCQVSRCTKYSILILLLEIHYRILRWLFVRLASIVFTCHNGK